MERILTVCEGAAALKLSPPTMYKRLKEGAIPGAVKVGHVWRISEKTLREYIRGGSGGEQKLTEQPAAA